MGQDKTKPGKFSLVLFFLLPDFSFSSKSCSLTHFLGLQVIAFFFPFPGPEYLLVLHAEVGLLDCARIWFKLLLSSPWLGPDIPENLWLSEWVTGTGTAFSLSLLSLKLAPLNPAILFVLQCPQRIRNGTMAACFHSSWAGEWPTCFQSWHVLQRLCC